MSNPKANRCTNKQMDKITKSFVDILKFGCETPKMWFQQMFELDEYLPTNIMKAAHAQNFSTKKLQQVNQEFCEYLDSPVLTEENLTKVFQTLLQICDLVLMSQYLTLSEEHVVLQKTKGFLVFKPKIETLSTMRNILSPFMDEVVLINSEIPLETFQRDVDKLYPLLYEHILTIQEIENDCIFLENKVPVNTNRKYNVIIRPMRLPLRYQYRALDLLTKKVLKYIFPVVNPIKELPQVSFDLINPKINSEQLQAIHNIVAGPNSQAPYIIFGPPGTGKTTTIVEAIFQLRLCKPKSRILITTSSNSACNTICMQIFKYFKLNPKLVRRMKQRMEGTDLRRSDLLRVFANIKYKGMPHDLIENSNFIKIKNERKYVHYYPSVEDLRNYGILVATLCTVGKYLTGADGSFWGFTHVFIDEAAATTEPETLIAIADIKNSDNCHIILSGDIKQLDPVVKAKRAGDLGLNQSLMARLLKRDCYAVDAKGEYDHTLQARLRQNYRSHPEILRMYSMLYYNNELLAKADKNKIISFSGWFILSNPNFPIIFQAVYGLVSRTPHSPSLYNDLEIQVVLWYVEHLIGLNRGNVTIQERDIGIISPYKLQCQHIIRKLQLKNWKNIEVGTVEIFQGREKPIIIASFVQSFHNIGFVSDPKRLNVIISRATSLIILIGNPHTLSRNADLRMIIDECKKKGTFRHKEKSTK